MPATNFYREVVLMEPALRIKAKEVCRKYNIPMSKLLRMSLKLALKDEKTTKQLLKHGDPSVTTDE